MPSIAIITDTDSSIPFDLAARYNIYQVLITLHFGEQSYEAVYALFDGDTFRRIDKEGKLPTTAASSQGKFIAAFKNAFVAGPDKIVCLCVSSEVSSTYNAAVSARESIPGQEIKVIDSRSLSMGLGYMVQAAAEAVTEVASIQDINSVIDDTRQHTYSLPFLLSNIWLWAAGSATSLQALPPC